MQHVAGSATIEEDGKTTPIAAAKQIDWPTTMQFDGQKPVLLHLTDNTIWLSRDQQTVASAPLLVSRLKNVWRSLEFVPIVSYDIKALYHAAHEQGVELRFDAVHDIRQAAFLINPRHVTVASQG